MESAEAKIDLNSFTSSMDKYEILGVTKSAGPDELKTAYRRLALLYHPDRHATEDKAKAEEIFRRVASAYNTLSDPLKRERYDAAVGRGIYPESNDEDVGSIPLTEVLRTLQTYEHVFSDKSLNRLNKALAGMVRQNLLSELNEQVIETLPLKSAPSNLFVQGSFKSGALVLTNWRLLIPFYTQWETRSGNTRTIHTRQYMPAVPLPLIRSIHLVSCGRHRPKIRIDITTQDRQHTATITKANVAKILMLCRIWGIPVSATEEYEKQRERRILAVWHPLWISALVFLAFWIFGEGKWEAFVLSFLALSACGLARYRWLYGAPSGTELISSTTPAQESIRVATGNASSAASGL